MNEYIGETGRQLKVRVKEHCTLSRDRSRITEVCSHSIEMHDEVNIGNWEIEVLYAEKDTFKRKAIESYFIETLKPSLNISKGVYVIGLDTIDCKRFNFE